MDRNVLLEAVETGEILTVVYRGGSRPGMPRQIAPIQVGERLVTARCYATERVKHYVIEKLELAGPGSEHVPVGVPGLPQFLPVGSISDLLKMHRAELRAMGWIVVAGKDQVGLHRLGRRGKPKRIPDVSVVYEEFGGYYDVTPTDDLSWVSEPRKRPWSVRSPNGSRAYMHFASASQRFLSEAAAHAPMTEGGG